MRFTLPESSPRRQRSAGGTLLSATVHAAVIAGTLVATGMSAERPRPPKDVISDPIFFKLLPKPDRPRPLVPPATDRRIVLPNTPPELPSTDVVIDASIIPVGIPPIDARLGDPSIPSATDASTTASEGHGAQSGAIGDGAPMSAFAVDREVVPLRGVTPRYPPLLASAGIEGTVMAQFVVDTLGHVERESVRVTRSDHALFEQSVRDALARMRFTPAMAQGRTVRQLVEQPFTFAITRR